MTELLDGVMAGKRRDSFVGEETARHDMLEAERLQGWETWGYPKRRIGIWTPPLKL